MQKSTPTPFTGITCLTANSFCKFLIAAFVTISCFFTLGTKAQSTANYAFATNTTGSLLLDANGNAIDLSSGTTGLVTITSSDQGVSPVTSIGFPFYLGGTAYTQFATSANGVIQLGATAPGSTTYVTSSGSVASPRISAYAADLGTGTSGSIKSKLVGASPNRCLVIEYSNMTLLWTTAYTNDGSYQVRLYENGTIEFVYGTMSITSTGSAGDATPGIGFSWGTAAGTFAYVTSSTNAATTTGSFTDNPTPATGPIINLNSAAEGSRRTYSFTPSAPVAPSALTFTAVTGSSMTLNWTDNSSNETAFIVSRSTDNINFTNVATTAANVTSLVQSGLSFGTTYYFRVLAIRETPSSYAFNSQSTSLGSLSGIKTVGTGGTYPNLTTAFADINSNGLSGNIDLQLTTGYPASAETYPIVSSNTSAAANFAIKVYPIISGLSITSSNATGTLTLNNAKNITIDGRVNQTGSKNLVIANTNAGTSYAVQFVTDATNNAIQYCTLRSTNTSTSSGTIVFAAASTVSGSDGNTIDNCDILDGATTPFNAIYSSGSSGVLDNSGNTISNCNIANYFSASAVSNAILLSATGNSGWTISNNRFYQEANRVYTSGNTHTAISIGTGAGYMITGNIIGYGSVTGTGTTNLIGNSANLAGFPSSYTTAGSATATRYIGINCAFTAGGAVSSIQGNTVAGFALYTSSGASATNGIWCGIAVTAGNANIGTTTGNTIGAVTGNGSVYTAATTASGAIVGIYATTANTVNIQNNSIGALDAMGTSASTNGSITGINTAGTSGIFNVTGNVIGNATNPNLRMGTLTTGANLSNTGTSFGAGTGTSVFNGILNSATGAVAIGTIASPNTIRNASVNATSSSTTFRGIQTGGGTPTIIGNIISDITSASSNAATGSGALAGLGIYLTSGTNPVIRQNTISNLSLTNTGTGGYNLAGISYTSPSTSISITRNLIFGLSNASTSTTVTTPGTASGIFIRDASAATTDISNNMIRLGLAKTDNTSFIGIWAQYISSSTTTLKLYHNSIDIEGSVTSGAQPSFGFYRGDFSTSSVTAYVIDAKNNILVNNRAGGTGKHYAIANNYGATTTSATNWGANASNFNILFGNAATIGYWTTDQTFAGWKTASASDASSISSNPLFAAAAAATPDLHLTPGSPAESAGTASATVTDDFDGEVRSGLSPVDIGADAGIYALTGTDVGVTGVINPTAISCHSAAENVIVTLKNYSANAIDFAVTPVTLTVNVTNAITAGPLTVTLNGSSTPSTLAAGTSANFTVGQINTTANGTYSFASSAAATGDVNASNDNNTSSVVINYTALTVTAAAGTPQLCVSGTSTLTATAAGGTTPYTYLWSNGATSASTTTGTITGTTTYSVTVTGACGVTATAAVTVEVNSPQVLTTVPGTRCGTGTVSLSGTGSAGSTLGWYANATGGSALGTGNNFTTPTISATTNFYVEAATGSGLASSVPVNPYFSGATITSVASPSNSYYMIFNSTAVTTIQSVTLYASTAGTLNLQLANSSGTVLQTATYTITAGQANSTTTVAGTPIVIPVNFAVPVGTALRLGIASGTTATLIRNSGGATSYYGIATGDITFTGNWLSDNTYWYFFYNVVIGNGCSSARTSVSATVNPAPAISINPASAEICTGSSTTLTASSSNVDYTYNWLPSTGLNVTTGTTVIASPSTATTYTVTATDNTAGAFAGCAAIATAAITVNTPPTVIASASATTNVCSGSDVILSAAINGAGGSYTAPPAVTSPTTDEDLGAITIKQGATTILSNTTSRNSLVGTIGTATGIAGSYSNFTAFGPYAVAAGQTYTFTLTTVDAGGFYSNSGAIYIDYNRNGTFGDPGEKVYAATSTTEGVHTETGSFTIPASALNGLTRMRVMINEGLITSPTQTLAYGEYEEYMLNISSSFPAATYSWSDGSGSIGSTNPLTVNPLTTTTYSVAVTSAGCTVNSNAVTVNVVAGPNPPNPSNSFQCGTKVPTAFVTSGGGGGGFKWYSAQMGGTLLQTGGSTYASPISTTTTFWVSESNGTCESQRVAVTVSVNPADAIQASASDSNPCLNSSILLTATTTGSTNSNVYNFSWTAIPVEGSGIPTSQPGGNGTFGTPASTSVTPTASGTYTYTVTGNDPALGCATSSTVVVTVKALPVLNSPTATPPAVCAGEMVSLQATTSAINAGNVTLGTDVTTTVVTGITPFSSNFEGSREQYLVKASELTGLGLTAGNLTSLAFNVTSTGSGTKPQTGFSIKIANTANTALVGYGTPVGAFTTVFGPSTVGAPAVGLRTFSFATPFVWDGTSNILIDICHDNDPTGTCSICYSPNSGVSFTATSFNSVYGSYADDAPSCGVLATNKITTFVNRPNMVIGGPILTTGVGTLNYVWNPGTLSGSTVTVNPTTTTVYTVTGTDPATTCSATATVNVTVHPIPPGLSGNNGTDQCGTAVTDASVSSNSGEASPVFNWYLVPTGGTPDQTGTSSTYLTAISTTTNFYVSEISSFGCEGPRVTITTVVSDADPISISATPTTVCVGGTASISASYIQNFNFYSSYELTASGGAGSGVTGTVTINSNENGDGSEVYQFTPTVSGTYTYTITAFDPDKGCTSVNMVTITIIEPPLISSTAATPSAVCAGGNVTLTATSILAASGTASVGTGSVTTTDYNGPFYSNWNNKHMQMMVKASELTAAGLTTGAITSLTFYTTAIDATDFNINFSIKMAVTANTTMAAFVTSGLTEVYTVPTYTPVVGANLITLATPFNWNGTSNIVLDICFGNPSNSNTLSSTATADATSYVSVIKTYTSSATSAALACPNITTNSSTYSVRPRISFGGQVGTNQTSSYNWVWNPGNINAGTTGTTTVTPSATTIYTVTATSVATGCSSNATVTVTVNPIPAAPTATSPVTRCGPGSITLTATGSGGTLNWYNVATGGTSLQAGNSFTTNISANTSFWVEETSTFNCIGPRKQVNATITAPPTLTITPGGSTSICQGSSVTLTAGGDPGYIDFAWSSTPSTAGGLSSTTGATVTATPTLPGSIVYTVNANDGNPNGCASIASITLTVGAAPVIATVAATPASSCAGGPVTLAATTTVIGPGVTSSIGTATTGTSTAGVTPYNSNFEGSRTQYLIRANELTAAGLKPGNITSVAFYVTVAGAGTFSQNNFTIKMAHTAQTAISGGYATPAGSFTTVLNPTTMAVPNVGLNTITFDAPFSWDGTSNVLVDICHDNDINASCVSCFSSNSTVRYSVTAYNSVYGSYADNVQSCGTTASSVIFTFTNRPNIIFGGQVTTGGAGTLNWTWNPGGLNGATVTVNPTATTSYTVTATNPVTGCSASSTPVTVTIVPVGASVTATPATPVCAGTSVTLAGTGTGAGLLTYAWTDGSTATYPATASISVTPAVTTSYTLMVTDPCGATAAAAITVTVNPLPTASVTPAGPITICAPATQVLTAVTDAATVSYQWTLNGANLPLANSSTYTVSSAGTGTYRVIVTNTTSNCVSAVSAGVVVTINPQPSTVSVTPASTTICAGAVELLTAAGGTIVSNRTGIITGTSPTTSVGAQSPFYRLFEGSRKQYLMTAAELTSIGMAAGSQLSSLSFDVTALSRTTNINQDNYNIKVAPTSLTNLSTAFETTGLSVVYGPVSYLPVLGTNTFNFSSSFTWNGTSNIVIEVCYDNDPGNTCTAGSPVCWSNAATVSVATAAAGATRSASADNTTGARDMCSIIAGGTATTSRPIMTFGFTAVTPTSTTWSPQAGLFTNAGATTAYTGGAAASVYASPSTTTTYTATATSSAGCTNSATSVITVNPRPTGVISGGATYCEGQGSTTTTLSIAVTGAGPWSGTLAPGAIPFSGSSSPITVAVTPTTTTTYTIATLNGFQCNSIAADLTGSATVTVNPTPATPTISPAGPITQCGGTVTLTSSSATGNQWNNGGSPIVGATNQTLVVSASGNYSVSVTNGSNCSATSLVTSVTINPAPATPTVSANGPLVFCEGGSVTLTSSSATSNQWNLGGAPIGGATSQTLVVTASGDYTVTVTNGFSCSATSAITTVTANPSAATPTASVVQPTCAVATGTINVTSPLGAGNTYSLDGVNFQSGTSFPGKAPGTYTLYVNNSFGCFAPATVNVTVDPQPFIPAAPTVTGIVNVCPYIAPTGGAPITFHASSPGATSYSWTIPPARVIIVSGQGTADLTVRFDTGYINVPNKQFRVKATSVCGTSALTVFYTLAQYPATPNPITGPSDACPYIGTATTVTYTTNKALSATGYIWTLPAGVTATHPNPAGENDTTIVVTFTSGFTVAGNITVNATNDCGTSGARNIFVSRNPPPQPGLITGPVNACEFSAPNGTPATYSVVGTPGVIYTWTPPAGYTNLTGQGTNSISFIYPNGFTTGTLSVIATSGCGTSVPRNLSIYRYNPAVPGVIDVIQTHFCGEGVNSREFTYQVSSMPAQAVSVQWTVPASATLVSGQGTTMITVSYPDAAVSGYVTAQGVSNCASGTVRSTTIKLPACPPPDFTGNNNGGITNPLVKGVTTSKGSTTVSSELMEVKIFPNPTVSDFKLQVITSQSEVINVRVFDNEGRLFKTFKLMPNQTIALGAELKAGSYMVEVRQGKSVKTTKVIKF